MARTTISIDTGLAMNQGSRALRLRIDADQAERRTWGGTAFAEHHDRLVRWHNGRLEQRFPGAQHRDIINALTAWTWSDIMANDRLIGLGHVDMYDQLQQFILAYPEATIAPAFRAVEGWLNSLWTIDRHATNQISHRYHYGAHIMLR